MLSTTAYIKSIIDVSLVISFLYSNRLLKFRALVIFRCTFNGPKLVLFKAIKFP